MSVQQSYSDEQVGLLLSQYCRTKEPRLRDDIVEHMRPLVNHVARKFAGKEPLEDLQSEGFVGLIRAVDRFVPGRGARFSTFAMHLVAGQIRHYLRDRGYLIRQPAWLQELDARVQKASSELEQRLQRTPTVEEVAAATNLTEEGVEELLQARQVSRIMRMEAPSDDGDEDFLDVDPEKIKSKGYHTLQLPIEDRIVLEGALEKLKDLERKVLYAFYYQDCNQSEIARRMGISCNYVGYILRKGLKQLRERLPNESAPDRRSSAIVADPTVIEPVTGLYTREYFETRLAEEISRSQGNGNPVSVCCLRLPRHLSDAELQEAANVLKVRTRKADIVARTSDAEFSVIFPNTGNVAEKVALRLAEQLFSIVNAPVHAASATFPDAGRNMEQLLAAVQEVSLGSPPAPPTRSPVLA